MHREPPPLGSSPGSWLAGVTVGADGEGGPTVTILPDTATTLVVRREPTGEPEVMVAGPRTRARYHRSEPGPRCLQLRIRPGLARPVVGEPLAALTDRIIPVTLADLVDELLALAGSVVVGEASVGLEAVLRRWLAPTSANDRARSHLVAEATRLLSPADGGADGGIGVAAVARRLHVSERQLRNLFTQAVGLSPKQFARIDRVRAVLARGPHDGLARAAGAAGYYDQPHMTAEFRRLMGVPPGAYLAGRLPSPSPCAHRVISGTPPVRTL